MLILKCEPSIGIEPMTYWLQVSCSTSWAKEAYIIHLLQLQVKYFYNINLSQNIPFLLEQRPLWNGMQIYKNLLPTQNYFQKKLAEAIPPIL